MKTNTSSYKPCLYTYEHIYSTYTCAHRKLDSNNIYIADSGNHVIKKDLMTSTVYSYPKEEENNTKK